MCRSVPCVNHKVDVAFFRPCYLLDLDGDVDDGDLDEGDGNAMAVNE